MLVRSLGTELQIPSSFLGKLPPYHCEHRKRKMYRLYANTPNFYTAALSHPKNRGLPVPGGSEPTETARQGYPHIHEARLV